MLKQGPGAIYLLIFALFFVVSPVKAQKQENDNARFENPAIKLEVNLVSFPVIVVDRSGRAIPDLDRDNFEVYEDGVKQEIAFFNRSESAINIGFVFDLSGSMGKKIRRAQEALKAFLEVSRDDDEFFLIGFADRPRLLQGFTSSRDKILNSLALIAPEGNTALYDAVYLALENIKRGRHPRSALVIISDGQDNHSRYSYDQIKEAILETDVQVYSVCVPGIWGLTDRAELYGRRVLRELAAPTGGKSYYARRLEDLDEALRDIGLQLRNQYDIGYTPSLRSRDGRWRKLKVKLTNLPEGAPKMAIRSRSGYRPL